MEWGLMSVEGLQLLISDILKGFVFMASRGRSEEVLC